MISAFCALPAIIRWIYIFAWLSRPNSAEAGPAILIITILLFHGRLINPPPDISVTSAEFSSREKCEAAADYYQSRLESKRPWANGGRLEPDLKLVDRPGWA